MTSPVEENANIDFAKDGDGIIIGEVVPTGVEYAGHSEYGFEPWLWLSRAQLERALAVLNAAE